MHGSIKSTSLGSSMDVGSAAFGEKKFLNRIKVKFRLKTRDLARKKFRIEKK